MLKMYLNSKLLVGILRGNTGTGTRQEGFQLVSRFSSQLSPISFHLHSGNENSSTHAWTYFFRPIHSFTNLGAAYHHYTENKEIIANLLGLTPEEIKKPPKKLIRKDYATAACAVLQDNEFGSKEILQHPDLFMMTPSSIKNYIEIMKETLFKEIKLKMITNFRTVHKQTIKVLNEKQIAPAYHEIVHNYCRILEIQNSKTENDIWDSLPKEIHRLTLVELRRQVIAHYLSFILEANPVDVKNIFIKQPRLDYRCLKWIKKSSSIMINDLEFPKEKLQKHTYLLHANPENTLKIIQDISTLSEIPLKQLVLSRPKILMSAYSSLIEIDSLFKEHQIPSESIKKYPEIYTLSAMTIKERLEDLDEIPEFRPLKRHPRVARLLYYQNKAKARIQHLRTLQLSGGSLHLLSADTKRFNKLMILGEMKTKGSDLFSYLSTYFESVASTTDVRNSLTRQPNWLHFSLVNVKDNLMFLKSFNVFSKSQILSALPICIYPKDKIENEFKNVIASNEAKITDDYFLHMVLYYLERAVHFSGDGVWLNNKIAAHGDDDDDHSGPNDTVEEIETDFDETIQMPDNYNDNDKILKELSNNAK